MNNPATEMWFTQYLCILFNLSLTAILWVNAGRYYFPFFIDKGDETERDAWFNQGHQVANLRQSWNLNMAYLTLYLELLSPNLVDCKITWLENL